MKKLLLKSMLLLCALIVGGASSVWAELTPAYTLTTPKSTSNNAYATNYDVTVDSKTWNAPGNQNFTGYWRIGGKGGNASSSESTFDRIITGKSTISDAIKKITINHNGKSNNNLTVNSVKLTVASNAAFTENVQEITVTPTISTSTAGSFDITPTSPATEWSADRYYKFTFNIYVKGTSNYGLDLTSIVFYKEVSGSIATVTFAEDSPSVLIGSTYTNTPTKTPSGLVVTYSSGTPAIASVDENTGEVTGVAVGKTTITANWAAQTVSSTAYAAGSASYDITVKGPITDGVFDFAINQDYGSGAVASTTIVTTETTWTALNVTMSVAGRNVWYNGNDLRLYKESGTNAAGEITISVPSGYVITKINLDGTRVTNMDITSGGGKKSGSSEASIWSGKSQSVKFTHNTGDATYLTKITIKYRSETATTVDATMGSEGYMTYCYNDAPLSFDDLEAFVVSNVDKVNGNVTLTPITKAPAGTPVILKGTGGAKTFIIEETPDDIASNKLKVSDGTATTGGNYKIYALAEKGGIVGFYLVDGVNVPSGKCYISVYVGGSSAREFLGFAFGDDATGLNEAQTQKTLESGEYYNLAGQRVANPTKGLYIVNGKKIIVK